MKLAFVAFVDILGFSQLVLRDANTANPGSISLGKLRAALSALPQGDGQTQVVQFSDCIVVSRPFEATEAALREFIDFVIALQVQLLHEGFLCRGGIAHGRHFQEEGVLYSQGLIEAYRLESQRALGPRIVVSRDLVDLIDPKNENDFGLLIDEDDELFANYLPVCDPAKVLPFVEAQLEKLDGLPESARRKWLWFHGYIMSQLPGCGLPPVRAIKARFAG